MHWLEQNIRGGDRQRDKHQAQGTQERREVSSHFKCYCYTYRQMSTSTEVGSYQNIKEEKRKTLEAAHIITRDTFNSRSGFISWAGAAAKLAVA